MPIFFKKQYEKDGPVWQKWFWRRLRGERFFAPTGENWRILGLGLRPM